jgi:L-rhamnose mutarotase
VKSGNRLGFFLTFLSMTRIAFRMQLKPGFEAEYRKRHDEIWPELTQLLREHGISEYSIFLDAPTGMLFGMLTSADPLKMDALPAHPVMKKWWTFMKEVMDTNPDHSPVSLPLQEVFHMD